ncbi:major tail protein V, partial [Escherichia coli UMEA 3257-1]
QRLAKVKDLTPGEMTAESYDDNYLDDEDADWTGPRPGRDRNLQVIGKGTVQTETGDGQKSERKNYR